MPLTVIRVVLLLLPVAFAIRMLSVWDRLPDSVASHFGAGGEPDSYLPRLAFLGIGIAVLAFTSVLFARRQGDSYGQGIAAGISVLITVAFWQVIAFNLGEGQVSLTTPLVAGGVTAVLVVGLARVTARSPNGAD